RGCWRNTEPEPAIRVMLINVRGKSLIPHGIGDDQIELPWLAVRVSKGRPPHGVAGGDLRLHIVNESVHPCHRERCTVDFLPKKLQRSDLRRELQSPVLPFPVRLQQPQMTLDEQ